MGTTPILEKARAFTVSVHDYDLQFPTTFISKDQNLELKENRFQELAQNCGMGYQLSSEHYQKLKGNSNDLVQYIRI